MIEDINFLARKNLKISPYYRGRCFLITNLRACEVFETIVPHGKIFKNITH
jgi:hypothetical protein